MATDDEHGIDVGMIWGPDGPDIDPNFPEINGARAVSECLARRLYTPRGRLLDAPNDGVYLPGYLNGKVDQARKFAIKAAIAAEARKDERVESVDVEANFDMETQKLRIDIAGLTAEGPFDLTLLVSLVSVEILNEDQ